MGHGALWVLFHSALCIVVSCVSLWVAYRYGMALELGRVLFWVVSHVESCRVWLQVLAELCVTLRRVSFWVVYRFGSNPGGRQTKKNGPKLLHFDPLSMK